MKAKIYEQYNAAVIELKGKVEGGPFASEFKETLLDLVNKGKKNIIVDMSDIKFINSNGIGILVSGYTTVRNGGGELKLVNSSSKVNGVLSITKLNQVFTNYTSLDEALKSKS
jgi:anti-sigma B factor antagonist